MPISSIILTGEVYTVGPITQSIFTIPTSISVAIHTLLQVYTLTNLSALQPRYVKLEPFDFSAGFP